MKNFLVLDDFTPPSLQDLIETVLLWNDKVSWGFRDQTSGVDEIDPNNPNIKENCQWQHDIFAYDRGILSEYFELLKSNLWFAEYATGARLKDLQRIKANMLVKDVESKGFYHPPHIDLVNDNSYSMVYYVHDRDGETILFKNRLKQAFAQDPNKQNYLAHDLEEIARIKPKKGRAVIFHSNRFHASSNPIVNERRVIINHVFTSDDDFLSQNT